MSNPSEIKSWAGLWVGLGLMSLSGLAAISTAGMKIAPNYARVGPQVFPYAAAIVLGALGLFFIWHALRQSPDRLKPDTSETDIRALTAIALGFVLFILTLKPLGFILAATLLFAAVARGFGSPRLVRDGLIGLALSCLAFVVFTRLLDLQLPTGSAYLVLARLLDPRVLADFFESFCDMESLGYLLQGFETAFLPVNLMWCMVGVTLGTLIGILPGIGPALTIALLLPVTSKLDPTGAFIMFAGLYYGAMYGSSTTSILLNTPGESGSIITAVEGNVMARKGRGAAALATAAIGSFVAGTIGTILLTFLAPVFVKLALHFGPAEYFALMVFAFTAASALLGSSLPRGLTSLFLGFAVGLVGIDLLTGQTRLSFGIPALYDGIDIVVVAVGLFAVGETLHIASRKDLRDSVILPVEGSLFMTREEWSRSWKPWLRGTFLGFPFGVLPAGGTEIPTFLSYFLEKKLARKPEEFGHGAIEGVAGPEAANNAAVAGVLVPLLTLGLPTSATAAILLVAFQQYGLQPGPQLFTASGPLIWGLIASLYVGNLLLLVLNLPLVGLWVRLLAIPAPLLYGGIMVFSALGVYGLNRSLVDLVMLFVLGVVGFLMRRYDFPVAPAIIGLILGPLAEEQFRRALMISQGDPTVFVSHPLSAFFLIAALMVFIVPFAAKRLVRPA